jgi:hypothetical protein
MRVGLLVVAVLALLRTTAATGPRRCDEQNRAVSTKTQDDLDFTHAEIRPQRAQKQLRGWWRGAMRVSSL